MKNLSNVVSGKILVAGRTLVSLNLTGLSEIMIKHINKEPSKELMMATRSLLRVIMNAEGYDESNVLGFYQEFELEEGILQRMQEEIKGLFATAIV